MKRKLGEGWKVSLVEDNNSFHEKKSKSKSVTFMANEESLNLNLNCQSIIEELRNDLELIQGNFDKVRIEFSLKDKKNAQTIKRLERTIAKQNEELDLERKENQHKDADIAVLKGIIEYLEGEKIELESNLEALKEADGKKADLQTRNPTSTENNAEVLENSSTVDIVSVCLDESTTSIDHQIVDLALGNGGHTTEPVVEDLTQDD